MIEAWLCPVCNKTALYTDLFIDQFFIDIINKCPLNAKAIEYEMNGQWKVIEEEKLSRRAQREKEAYKATGVINGRSSADIHQPFDSNSNEEQTRTSQLSMNCKKEKIIQDYLVFVVFLLGSVERQVSAPVQVNIPLIELDDD